MSPPTPGSEHNPGTDGPGLAVLFLAALVAVPLTRVVLGSETVRTALATEMLGGAKPGGDRSYDHLLWKSIQLEREPRGEHEQQIFLTGSSVIMLNVGLPQMAEALNRRTAGAPVHVEKLTGGHATVRDIRLWLGHLAARKPEVVVFGLYYNTLQPSHRRPDMGYWYPADNATYLRALYASATVDLRQEWDPDSRAPRLVGEWSRKRWPPGSDRLLRPYDPFPNAETEALLALARDCRAEGIRLILVRTPINPEFYPVYEKARHYREYGDALEATRTEGTEVWNLETVMGRDTSQFHDLVHLTPTGRERFTGILADRLSRMLEVPRVENPRLAEPSPPSRALGE